MVILRLLFFNSNIITWIAVKLLYSWIYLYYKSHNWSVNSADYIIVQYCTVSNLLKKIIIVTYIFTNIIIQVDV